MLPIYNYTGLVTNPTARPTREAWSTIAVDPTYINIHLVIRSFIPAGPSSTNHI